MANKRTEFQKEVAEALISSNSINFEVIGGILAKYGARAARTGEAIGVIINWRLIDVCIPPDPYQISTIGYLRGSEAARE
jgi:hypothetical protein